ncbi:MAG: alpha-L-fucosidase [Prolixibacteraceae bacterium]|jgi:alpha-L-fucosidase|nr:alpha-L-fucosidase [Prolixibacteraceae bacterium]
MRKYLFALLCIVCISLINNVRAQHYQPTWESIDSRPVPEWFTGAKFGIFIHWGLYSVPSWGPTEGSIYEKYAEWYWKRLETESFSAFHNRVYGEKFRYQDFVKDFKAEMFEPDVWARILRQSGAKYVVLTSKHHEGFALWPSPHSWNWNAVDAGPHRDLAGDLIKSVRSQGLRMGFYYSLYEWFNPLYKEDPSRYVDEHMLPQMKDLVNRYHPDILWTDGEWDFPSEMWKSTGFLAWLYNESPVRETVVVNDRWGKETRGRHGGIYTTEYDLVHEENVAGARIEHPWEECRGIGGSFGYNRNERLEHYETSESLVHILIDKVARGGNLLLNIGPTADGRIPVIMQQRLKDIGDWLTLNGEGIYGTQPWDKAPPIRKETTVFFTKKGDDLYAVITRWQDAPIVIEGAGKPGELSLLGFDGKIKYNLSGKKLIIHPPVLSPATNPCNYAWVFKIKGGAK